MGIWLGIGIDTQPDSINAATNILIMNLSAPMALFLNLIVSPGHLYYLAQDKRL